jgi:glycosyltransferase involved in cell wall biosynthesis
MSIEISVVVCTYNRADLLQNCLRSLVEQTWEASRYEVLVVNNNSTDCTQHLIDKFCIQYPNFRGVIELEQGISAARNRGWQKARGQYIAYIDDDAEAMPDWLSEIDTFIQQHPHIQVFGGFCESFSSVKIPEWFPGYGSVDLGSQDRPVDVESEWLLATNSIFKKEVFHQWGGFDKRLGMIGNKVGYGEETQFFLLMQRHGIPVFYAHKVKIRHFVPEYKIKLSWLLKSNYASGLTARATLGRNRKLYSHLYGLIKSFTAIPLTLFKPVPMPLKKRFYLTFSGICWETGAFMEYLQRFKIE